MAPDQLNPQYLRNRVSFVQVFNNAADNYAASATHYSYDKYGNVDTFLQDIGYGQTGGILNAMNTSENRFKKIVYNYEQDQYGNGQTYQALKLTVNGEEWVMNNQDQLKFRKDSSNVNAGEDLPF